MNTLSDSFRNRRVLITGHTGFKGAWLSQWLVRLGAHVSGYALAPEHGHLYQQLQLDHHVRSVVADIRDSHTLRKFVSDLQPEFIFHLAAQSLVRRSYREPSETIATNLMGTVNVLEAVRSLNKQCTLLVITSDKCYHNRESHLAYREDDPLGGADPYSSSKAMAELAVDSYRRSFYPPTSSPVRIASCRAGNVIGGGDWAEDRILPDCIRALTRQIAIEIRNPNSTRPWQHVLEPLYGYLALAARLDQVTNANDLSLFSSAFNFSPLVTSNRSVQELVDEVLRTWPGERKITCDPQAPAESSRLSLAIDKAHALLGWRPHLDFVTTVQWTVDWYRRINAGQTATSVTIEQIEQFEIRVGSTNT